MLTGGRLLIVDDEPDVAMILRHGFRKHVREQGWHLEFAQHGEEALECVQRAEFDAIVTDINMPVMDGLTLLRELAALEHDTKAMVVSAYSDMPNIRRAMQLGAIDFVTKPIDMADMIASVTKTAAVTRRLKLARSLELQKAHLEAHRDALTTFLKIAAHDLRDPLAAIRMGTRILASLSQGAAAQEALDVIRGAEQRAQSLLESYLKVATIEAGHHLKVEVQSIELRGLVEEEIGFLSATLPDPDVVSFHNQVPALQVDADPQKLRQVVYNLLSNAAKYSPTGSRVTLGAEVDGNAVTVRVTDEGIGISPEDQARLFEQFSRVGDVSMLPGTGLGLWLANELVAAHGGTMRVQSEPGQGSSFIFSLPHRSSLCAGDAERDRAEQSPAR